MYQLYIANKNYSSWSMRPWLVLKAFNLPFEEIMLPFPSERGTGTFKQDILAINPNAKVPVLVDDGLMLWDSLAILNIWRNNIQIRLYGPKMLSNVHVRAVYLQKCTADFRVCAMPAA